MLDVATFVDGHGWDFGESIWPVVYGSLANAVTTLTVAVKVHVGTDRAVDWELVVDRKELVRDNRSQEKKTYLFPIDTKPCNLGIEIREVPSLQQWIVAESNTRYDMTRTKRNLLCLRKVLIDNPVKHHLPNRLNGHKLFRPDLGSIEDIEGELMFVCLWNDLHSECPFRIGTSLDSLVEVFTVEIGILTADL